MALIWAWESRHQQRVGVPLIPPGVAGIIKLANILVMLAQRIGCLLMNLTFWTVHQEHVRGSEFDLPTFSSHIKVFVTTLPWFQLVTPTVIWISLEMSSTKEQKKYLEEVKKYQVRDRKREQRKNRKFAVFYNMFARVTGAFTFRSPPHLYMLIIQRRRRIIIQRNMKFVERKIKGKMWNRNLEMFKVGLRFAPEKDRKTSENEERDFNNER